MANIFSKSKDCYVWDLNKKKYVDLGLIGVGTNVLGYNNNKINKSVIKAIKTKHEFIKFFRRISVNKTNN